jgi:hypothetical protein
MNTEIDPEEIRRRQGDDAETPAPASVGRRREDRTLKGRAAWDQGG